MTLVKYLIYVVVISAGAIADQHREGMDRITLALLDILVESKDSNNAGDFNSEDPKSTVDVAFKFSTILNTTATRLDELGDIATKHGDLLAYLLNRMSELRDGMDAMIREIVSRDDAKNDVGAVVEAMAKEMEARDQVSKRLQENFAAIAKEVLLKDLITMELRDRLEEVDEKLEAKEKEIETMQQKLNVLAEEVASLRIGCCTKSNKDSDESVDESNKEGFDNNKADEFMKGINLQSLASATYLVYANNTIRSSDTMIDRPGNRTGGEGGGHNNQECLPPFRRVGRGCFYVHTKDVRSWEDAREYCKHLKGDLAEPREDLFSLRAHLQGRQARGLFWLGATDLLNPGVWLWISGAPMAMGTNVWAAGQPDGSDQHCLYLDSGKQFRAGNIGCKNHTYFVCGMELA